MIVQNFESFMQAFAGWASAQPEILAVIVIGSQARSDRPADEWSDLDLIAYTMQPDKFVGDSHLPEQFGEVWAQAVEHTSRKDPEWFIFYAGGRKVDILFVDIRSLHGDDLAGWIQHPDFSDVLPRGIRVLVDKSASQGSLPELPVHPSELPLTQKNLDRLTNRFYLSAVRAGRLLHRADLWRARQAVDDEMKTLLLRMLEWHAVAHHGPDFDIWYGGRFLEEWIDPQVFQRLPKCFGGLELKHLRDAFSNTMNLFDDLGRETAALTGLNYPSQISNNVRNWVLKKTGLTVLGFFDISKRSQFCHTFGCSPI